MEIDKPITTAILLFLSLVAIFYLVMPKYDIYQGLLNQISIQEAIYNGQDQYYSDIKKNYDQLMQYKDNLAKIDDAIPSKSAFSKLLNLLYKDSADSGIVIQNISAANSQQAGNGKTIKQITLSLNLFGSYAAYKNFLVSLEGSARLIESQDFNFSVTQPSKQNPNPQGVFPIKMDIKVHSY
jgi:Tfp pilus assembly protein PilO